MHNWGKYWTQDTTRLKNPTATSEEPGEKIMAHCMTLAYNTTREWENHLNQPSGLTLEQTPTITPYMEQTGPSSVRKQASEPVVCSHGPA